MKAYSLDTQYDYDLLDLFEARRLCKDYKSADEFAYLRVLNICKEQSLWQESLEILSDLMFECDAPSQKIFELVVNILAENKQV